MQTGGLKTLKVVICCLIMMAVSVSEEWILMKVSGRQCESLELNAEDRKRIEDIKRELLLNTQHKVTRVTWSHVRLTNL